MQIDDSPRSQMVFGVDVDGMHPGQSIMVDDSASGYPLRSLRDVPPGEYYVQAFFNVYSEFHRSDGHVVWIIEGEQQLNQLDLQAAEHAAVVAALHVAHQGRLAAAEARLGASFLDTLLEGRFEATGRALERARLLGFSPEATHRAAVAVLDEPLPLGRDAIQKRERLAERLRWHLTSHGAMAVTSSQLRHVTFLLPAELDPARTAESPGAYWAHRASLPWT